MEVFLALSCNGVMEMAAYMTVHVVGWGGVGLGGAWARGGTTYCESIK